MIRNFCQRSLTVRGQVLRSCVGQRAFLSATPPVDDDLTEGEKKLRNILFQKFPLARTVEVSDISGGCGAMYEVSIEAEEFRGQKTIKQHRMVNEALSAEIKLMHGLKINTVVPES